MPAPLHSAPPAPSPTTSLPAPSPPASPSPAKRTRRAAKRRCECSACLHRHRPSIIVTCAATSDFSLLILVFPAYVAASISSTTDLAPARLLFHCRWSRIHCRRHRPQLRLFSCRHLMPPLQSFLTFPHFRPIDILFEFWRKVLCQEWHTHSHDISYCHCIECHFKLNSDPSYVLS
jgi:hypothetical protein